MDTYSEKKTIFTKSGKIVLAGGGGHALSILEMSDPDDFAGYIALTPSEAIPLKWLGNDSAVKKLADEGYEFHMAFVYSGLPIMQKRRKLIEQYESEGARFTSIIAPTAIISRNSRIGAGAAVLSGAIVNRAVIKENVVVNSGAIVEHDCIVGANSFIGPGAVVGGAVTIGEDCFIGLGAKIKNCVTIASGVTVAMGAVVTRDLLQPGIYHGTPLRLHKIHQ